VRRTSSSVVALALALALALAACTSAGSARSAPSRTSGPAAAGGRAGPSSSTRSRWHHIVVVVMENHSYSDIIGNPDAPYLNSLAARGASFSRIYAETHPSEPNYLALFSGSTHGLSSDRCPLRYPGPNLGSELLAAHYSFAGYSEGLPHTGWSGCASGAYARKHVPWSDFSNLPSSVNKPMTTFPSDPSALPAVSFVIPNLNHDMHDGTVAAGDRWVRQHLRRFAGWATAHGSLLIITWDEDDHSENNRIPTLAVGAGVQRGIWSDRVDHYRLLRTLDNGLHIRPIGRAAKVASIPELSN
jgi:phosphatidylinositol-3-phosphatase